MAKAGSGNDVKMKWNISTKAFKVVFVALASTSPALGQIRPSDGSTTQHLLSSEIIDAVKPLGDGARPEPTDVFGPLPSWNLESTILAKQAIMPDGRLIGVYAIGAATAGMATAVELQRSPNKNPIALFNTIERTVSFVAGLVGLPYVESDVKSVRGARERGPVLSPEEIVAQAERARQRRPPQNLK